MKTLMPHHLAAAISLLSTPLAAEELYHLDFRQPEVGSYETVFGSPTVQSRVGPFRDALVFSATSHYEQIRLPLETAAPRINIRFDVLAHNLLATAHQFTLHLDTPGTKHHTVSLSQSTSGRLSPISIPGGPLGIRVWQSYQFGEHVALWTDDQVYHFDISIDLEADRWAVAVDGTELYANTFNAAALESIRFNLGPRDLRRGMDYPATYVALDNVVVTAVPEPSTLALLVLGVIAHLTIKRHRTGQD